MKKLKEKNYVIISTHAEKTFDKNPTSIPFKNIQQTRNRGILVFSRVTEPVRYLYFYLSIYLLSIYLSIYLSTWRKGEG